MGQLIYAALTSLDGYTADAGGTFDWALPPEDVHAFVNDLEARNSALVLGRRMYEVLTYWESVPNLEAEPPVIQDYQRAWSRERKVVYSRTLEAVTTARTVLRREFRPDEIAELKRTEPGSVGIGGAHLASQALNAGLLDEVYQFLFPVLVGGGTRWLGATEARGLDLLETRTFSGGVVLLHYRVDPSPA